MRVLIFSALGFAFLGACSGPIEIRKTEWTKKEVVEWYSKSKNMIRPPWRGLFYRGSDSSKHYFLTRVMDDFVFFEISRTELSVPEEHPYSTASDAPMYYYRVDPKNDFVRVKEQT